MEILRANPLRFLLVEVIDPHYHRDIALGNFQELELLVSTFGGQVTDKMIQHRVAPHPATYVGAGKVEQIKQIVTEKKIDVVVLNAIVNAGQIFRLEKILWDINPSIQVWDKADLILQIFEKHASSTETKLQIELAKLQHLGPRIYGLGATYFSRQTGGIGTRGIGETNIELMKRHIKSRTKKIHQDLEKVLSMKQSSIQRRKQTEVPTAALVGYTNAGKTSLFNLLTNKEKLVQNALFTTLDSTVGKLQAVQKEILISDTIGFIEGLPPFLIEAFKSTLLESLNAHVLLLVIDASDTNYERKISVVEKILHDLQIGTTQQVLIFNKTDRISMDQQKSLEEKYKDRITLFVSAKGIFHIDQLKQLISQHT